MPAPDASLKGAPATDARSSGWFFIAALIGVAVALVFLWSGWCAFPRSYWNELRLAPAFALREGVPLYPGSDGGPLSTWIYGPVGAVINLPATFASTAVAAVMSAGLINLLTLVVPFAIVCFTSRELQERGWATRMAAWGLCVASLPILSLQFQVADHSSAAFGLLSCWCLAQNKTPGRARLIAAAFLCALSIWSKQTSLFLVPAQVAFLVASDSRVRAIRYLAGLAALGMLSLAAGAKIFGVENLWLNLIEIPAQLPWGDVADKVSRRLPELIGYVVLPLPFLALARRTRFWPERSSEMGRFLRLCLLAYVCLMPVGLVAFCKIGGDLNTLHAWYYVVPAMIIAGVRRTPKGTLGWSLGFVAAMLILTGRGITRLPHQPVITHLEFAERLATANPEAIWFPCNPVVTFYSDHKLYHVEDAIATRHLAGLPLRRPAFQQHLPAQLQAIVYPSSQTQPFALRLLWEFTVPSPAGSWTIYTQKIPPNTPDRP